MGKSKKYFYEYEDYEEEGKDASTLLQEILADSELPELEELIIGCWGASWDEKSEEKCQRLIDGIVENKDKFSHIKSLFVGDMDYEECEVSWIIQADYSKLWEALPQLEKLIIKGSTELSLGEIKHDNLKSLEIICGGLPKEVIESIQKAKLPALERLMLYIGVEDYGFDGDADTIKNLLEKSDFPKLTYLGITDSEIQDDLAEIVLDCKYMKQIETLDLSYGTLTDKGGQVIAEKLKDYPNIKKVIIEHHFLSDKGVEELKKAVDKLGKELTIDDQQEAEDYDGEIYYYAMLTE